MRDKKLSLRGLARRMGMSHSQLSLTFSGDRKMQLEEAVQLSSILGQPLACIIGAAGVSVNLAADIRVPVIGAVRGDGTVEMTPEDVAERTMAPGFLPDDAVAIQFRTAGTPLEWADGAVSFCPRPNGIDQSGTMRVSLIKIKDGPVVVAAARRGYKDGSHNLSGPYQADNVVIEWATPILITRT